MFKLLISDMDGTLLATEDANFRAYARAFSEVGFSLGEEAYRRCFGLRFERMVEAVAPHLSLEARAQVKEAKSRYYRDEFPHVRPNLALLQFLRSMRGSHTVALATTSSKKNAVPLLEHFGALGDFDHLLFGEDVRSGKPDPECYLTLMERVGVSPAECLVFEDSEVGIEAATRAGAHVLKVQA